MSTAIDRYVYMLLSADFQPRYRLKHLEWGGRLTPPRCAIRSCGRRSCAIGVVARSRLASVADAPPGTGLGSSGAYAVCAINALRLAGGAEPSAREVAEAACELEIDLLGRAVGKQDQYAAAFGGVRAYTFNLDDSVDVRALQLRPGWSRP